MNEPVKVTYDLEDILKKIDEKLDKMEESSHRRFEKLESKLDGIQKDVDHKLDTLQKDVTDLKVGQAKLEEKVDGLGKRLDYQEFINRGVIIGLIVTVLGSLAKMLGFIGNS
ncbi:DUF4164 family protein [Crocosphaera sp.]|uniref:coiled-coil domain-containing protein n=1 Tax=Crocosphaera sp. TaxID=2729996 RepID=UPI0026289079|nr:DUF4164 family protein [Crocosphaera sp.]MDJ0581716.1 DUF4164 family protein [Crocosphaera sp.]